MRLKFVRPSRLRVIRRARVSKVYFEGDTRGYATIDFRGSRVAPAAPLGLVERNGEWFIDGPLARFGS